MDIAVCNKIPRSKSNANASNDKSNRCIAVGDVAIGNDFVFMAGPCSVEDEYTTLKIAEAVRKAGAHIFRGGAFKPRTSPHSFQGHGLNGLKTLHKVRTEIGLPVVTEIMDTGYIDTVCEHADIVQIGMRNMRNYPLLTMVGKTQKPVILKRGDSSTVEEWLLAAEYISKEGNDNIILCERGIRTFESATRNTFDVNAIVLAKRNCRFPVIADPSHGTGRKDIVCDVSKSATAAGADGLLIEAHTNPEKAVSDAAQTVSIDCLRKIINDCRALWLCNQKLQGTEHILYDKTVNI